MSAPQHTLGPAVSGTWYPSDPAALGSQIERYMQNVPVPAGDERSGPVALIAPHAGYVYSGQVAAHGFRLLEGRSFERVVVLGPSHYAGFQGAALPDAKCYRTPLGEVPIDLEGVSRLESLPGFQRSNRPFEPEHSLEAEIPFLQHVLKPGWKLLPILIGGGSSYESGQPVAQGVRSLLGPGCLAVVSSDFTHFGAHFRYVPFTEDVPHNIRQLDLGAIRQIEAGDVTGFEEYVARTSATICGRGAIDVLMRALPENVRASLVAYDTSGNMTGDWSHSVSYATLVFRPSVED